MKINLGKIVIGGVSASIVLWLLMQYSMRIAWLYLIILLLGIMFVYGNIIFSQITNISNLLVSLTSK